MKYSFEGYFVQVTAETEAENLMLLALRKGEEIANYQELLPAKRQYKFTEEGRQRMSEAAHKRWKKIKKRQNAIERGKKAWATRMAKDPQKAMSDVAKMLKAKFGREYMFEASQPVEVRRIEVRHLG